MTMSRVSYEDVIEKWAVPPEKLGDVLALAGDNSDNVPGVPGVGPKIAASLINDFGSLDNLLENLDNVKQKGRREKLQKNIEQARLSRRLVELERRVPIEQITFPDGVDKVADLRMSPMKVDRLVEFFDEMGLRDLKRRFEDRLQQQRGIRGSPPPPKSRQERPKFIQRPKVEIPKPEDFKDVPF
jgi:DNA polymerase-1